MRVILHNYNFNDKFNLIGCNYSLFKQYVHI
nr:MAG TPA: hypothetical protein [Caudoviricetes sp.]